MKNKIVVYTCITGGYDKLREPEFISEGVDYICFTDDKSLASDVYEIREIEDTIPGDNIKTARMHKILAHKFLPEYEYSFWLDGNLDIVGDLNKMIPMMGDADLMIKEHYARDCIYQEMRACKQLNKDNLGVMDAQIQRYKKDGYPENKGLHETNLLLRRHNEKDVIEFDEEWWKEVRAFSRRDQLSFDYILRKLDMKITDYKGYLTDYYKMGNKFHG
jgi:hypothetical protein